MQILKILTNKNPLENYQFFNEFKKSNYYQLLIKTYENLNTEILFDSKIHGQNHIERVILFSLILSWKYNLNLNDTNILLYAASLHDTQRENDSYDTEHGFRAAIKSIDYAINLELEDKKILQGIMAAHSRSDDYMEKSIKYFEVKDLNRAIKLTKLFKDSDGLDRVRINDLKKRFLRNEFSIELVDFAKELFSLYP